MVEQVTSNNLTSSGGTPAPDVGRTNVADAKTTGVTLPSIEEFAALLMRLEATAGDYAHSQGAREADRLVTARMAVIDAYSAHETDWERIARERTADIAKADEKIERLERELAERVAEVKRLTVALIAEDTKRTADEPALAASKDLVTALILTVNARIPSGVTPATRIEIHPSEWLILVDELDGANRTIANFIGPEGDKYIDRFAAMLAGPVSLEESIRKYSPHEPCGECDTDQHCARPYGICVRASQPPNGDRDGFYTMSQISYALNRSLYAKTGKLAIDGIIDDLAAALKNGGDHPMRNAPTKGSAT